MPSPNWVTQFICTVASCELGTSSVFADGFSPQSTLPLRGLFVCGTAALSTPSDLRVCAPVSPSVIAHTASKRPCVHCFAILQLGVLSFNVGGYLCKLFHTLRLCWKLSAVLWFPTSPQFFYMHSLRTSHHTINSIKEIDVKYNCNL